MRRKALPPSELNQSRRSGSGRCRKDSEFSKRNNLRGMETCEIREEFLGAGMHGSVDLPAPKLHLQIEARSLGRRRTDGSSRQFAIGINYGYLDDT